MRDVGHRKKENEMKMIHAAILALLTLSVSGFAEPSQDGIKLTTFGTLNRSSIFVISKEVFQKQVEWSPLLDDPPISIRAVADLATRWYSQAHTDQTQVIESIELKIIPRQRVSDRRKWFYQVTLLLFKETTPLLDKDTVVILCDGTVVEPITEDR